MKRLAHTSFLQWHGQSCPCVFATAGGRASSRPPRRSERLSLGNLANCQRLAPLAFLFLLAGCMVGPNYKRPAASLPPAYRGAAPAAASTASAPSLGPSLGNEKWFQVFQDPVLVNLIRTALANNYDVRIAATRVIEAQEQVGITRANEYPFVSAGAGAFAEENAKVAKQFPSYQESDAKLNFSVIWDLDFWGKYRRETQAARDELLSTEWGQRAVATSVVADVATAYFQLRALDSELQIAQRTLASRQDSLRLITVLARNGSASGLDLSQARQLVYAASEAIPDLQRQIAQQENLLSILLGRDPGPIVRGRPLVEQSEPQAIPAGLPSELLDRRPDIGEAEANLMIASEQIGILKASLFPDISLTATGGVESDALDRLLAEPAEMWNTAVNVAQPVFEAGALRAGVRLAKAQLRQMLLTYRETILAALEQVSDGLAAYDNDRQFTRQQQQLTDAAQESERLSLILYHNGGASYLQVLTSETAFFSAQLDLVQAQLNERLALVQIYQALGGGWQ